MSSRNILQSYMLVNSRNHYKLTVRYITAQDPLNPAQLYKKLLHNCNCMLAHVLVSLFVCLFVHICMDFKCMYSFILPCLLCAACVYVCVWFYLLILLLAKSCILLEELDKDSIIKHLYIGLWMSVRTDQQHMILHLIFQYS